MRIKGFNSIKLVSTVTCRKSGLTTVFFQEELCQYLFCLVCLEHLRKCSSLINTSTKVYFGLFFFTSRDILPNQAKNELYLVLTQPKTFLTVTQEINCNEKLKQIHSHYYHIQYTIFDTLKHKYQDNMLKSESNFQFRLTGRATRQEWVSLHSVLFLHRNENMA